MSARDELALNLAGAYGDTEPYNVDFLAADDLIAAGYAKPRIITTHEEVYAMKEGSVLLDREMDAFKLVGGIWQINGFGDNFESHEIYLPATAIYEPTP